MPFDANAESIRIIGSIIEKLDHATMTVRRPAGKDVEVYQPNLSLEELAVARYSMLLVIARLAEVGMLGEEPIAMLPETKPAKAWKN